MSVHRILIEREAVLCFDCLCDTHTKIHTLLWAIEIFQTSRRLCTYVYDENITMTIMTTVPVEKLLLWHYYYYVL